MKRVENSRLRDGREPNGHGLRQFGNALLPLKRVSKSMRISANTATH